VSDKRLSRREFLVGLAAGAGATVLAACQPQVVEKEVPVEVTREVEVEKEVTKEVVVKETVVVEGEAPAPAQTVLTFGRHWSIAFRGHQEEWDNMFMERHPEIIIKRTYNTWGEHNQIVPTWAAAGELPDIIYVHGRYAFPWNYEGILISIQSYVDEDEEFNVGGVWEEALKLYQFQGEQYEIPYDHGPVILGYNKNLFDEAGVDYPAEDWTMDDMLEAAKELTKPGVWGYGGYYGTTFGLGNELGISLVGPWGGEVLNEQETEILLDSPEAMEAIQWWADLIHVHKVAPTPADAEAVPAGVWVAGVAAMFGLASWGTPQLHEFAAFEWDVAPWPKGPVQQITGSFGSGFGITRDCVHPDVAWSYLREYLSKEGMEFMWGESGRGSPARKAAYQSWIESEIAPDHAAYYRDALENYAVTGHPYHTLAGGEIMDIFNRNTGLVQTGDATVEEAVQAIIDEGEPVLQEAHDKLTG